MCLGFGVLVGACAEEEPEPSYEPVVEVEVNRDVDLSKYTSFDIIDPAPSAEGEPPPQVIEAQAQLEDAIVAELSAKGLTRDRKSPQLLVNPLVNVEQATSAARYYEAYYGWYWGYEYLWTLEYDYLDGSLVLDVVDRGDPDDVGDDLLVYRGAVHGLLAEDIDVIELQIRNATQAIFAQWPTSTPT
jgi:hypothetical protein